ncbi:CBS domain-containing protein [Roseateles sp. BYS96W]|uniref:CBS domain-containing protein n=1 Tax=Pelomonas nitida TaxID=3299027 RepID=A0ABW7G9T2_9BURK
MNAERLPWHERLHHRDALRAGRYAALADAEGFEAICFALEALGLRLLGEKKNLGKYAEPLGNLARKSVVLSEMSQRFPERFSGFQALMAVVKGARNDAMHTGVYARHATAAAIELCIGLEEALMNEPEGARKAVKDFMVKSPVVVEAWQPVAHARQLMLTHSFSFLPVYLDGAWRLLSEGGLARYVRTGRSPSKALAVTIENAAASLHLVDAKVVDLDADVDLLLTSSEDASIRLWLVADAHGRLCGVLSPFELM